MGDLRSYHAVEQLKNGMAVTVRAIRPDDKDRITEAFRNLDRESVYTRFFGFKRELTQEDLKTATEVDFENVVALVVTKTEGQVETIIGSGRYVPAEVTPFPKGHVSVATSWSDPKSACALHTRFGAGNWRGPVRFHIDLNDAF